MKYLVIIIVLVLINAALPILGQYLIEEGPKWISGPSEYFNNQEIPNTHKGAMSVFFSLSTIWMFNLFVIVYCFQLFDAKSNRSI